MTIYQYCQRASPFEWLNEPLCSGPGGRVLLVLIFLGALILLVGALGFIGYAISEAIEAASNEEPAADLDAEIEQLRKEAEYYDARIKHQMKQHQLTVLDDFIGRHDL